MEERYRNIALILEIEKSIKLLHKGLAEVQNITLENDFYDPVLMFLSGGLERLFKTMLCLNFKQIKGRFPYSKEIWNYNQGHDIVFLKSKVESICVAIDRPFAVNDFQILTNNTLINQICKTLSEYGQKARYFHMDVILGTEQLFDSKKEWEKIETILLKQYYGEEEFYNVLSDTTKLSELYLKSSDLIVPQLEQFFRAITRQFIFGKFSDESNMFISQIKSFSQIEDHQLGKRDYRNIKN